MKEFWVLRFNWHSVDQYSSVYTVKPTRKDLLMCRIAIHNGCYIKHQEMDRIGNKATFTNREIGMLMAYDIDYHIEPDKDLAVCTVFCTCDFYSVILVTGCKCGGK